MDASNDILFNMSALHSLKRQQLIVLCKRYKVKASGKNDDIVARLQAYGQSLIEDSRSLHTASTHDSSEHRSPSNSDETPRAEDGTNGRATANALADTTPNATISVPGLTLRASSRDWTDSKCPGQKWEIVEEQEAEFGELKAAGTAESISSKSTACHALTVGGVSDTSSKFSAPKGSTISSGIMSFAKSIKSVASKTTFKASGLGSASQPAAPAHYALARTTAPSAETSGFAVSSEQRLSALDPTTDKRRDSLHKPIVESKVDAASASSGEATIRLVTIPSGGSLLVGEDPATTTEKMIEASGEGPMDVDLSSTGLTSPVIKHTNPPAFVFGSPSAGVSNTQFGNAAAFVLEEMNRRLGVSSGGAKITDDGGKVEFGVLPGLKVDVSKTLEKLRFGKKEEGRFTKAHEKEFARMDSIANHYSVRHPQEKIAGKKRKSMEGASHHDTLDPLKEHGAKDGPTAKRQKTGDGPSLSRKGTTSLVAKGKELLPKSQDKGVLLKKSQRDRERRRSSRGFRVGGVRRPCVSGPSMGKPGVAANASRKLGLLQSGAEKIRSMLGSASAVTPVGATAHAPAKTEAKETATTCAPPTPITLFAEPKGRRTPGPTSRPNTIVPKASSSSSAAKSIAQRTCSVPRKLAIHPATSQIPSVSAAVLGTAKYSESNPQQCGAFDKANTPALTEILTVKSSIVAPGAQVLMPPAAPDVSNTAVNTVVGSAKKTVRLTPHSQRTSRLYTPTASSLARMAATNANYRMNRILSPGGASRPGLDNVQKKADVLSPNKTTAEFKSLTRAPTTPTHTLLAIASKTPYKPLSLTPANNGTAAEADGISPMPSPPAQLSKTNTLTPRKARSPLSQANRPHISRSKVIAKVEEQRAAAATAAGTSNSPGTPGKLLKKSATIGAGTVAKASAMGETPQEHKGALVQEAFERRVRLSEAAIRRSRIGQMPIV